MKVFDDTYPVAPIALVRSADMALTAECHRAEELLAAGATVSAALEIAEGLDCSAAALERALNTLGDTHPDAAARARADIASVRQCVVAIRGAVEKARASGAHNIRWRHVPSMAPGEVDFVVRPKRGEEN